MSTSLFAPTIAVASGATDSDTRSSAPTRRARGCAARLSRVVLRGASVSPPHARREALAASNAGMGREPSRVPARDSAQGWCDHLELSGARSASQVDSAHHRSRWVECGRRRYREVDSARHRLWCTARRRWRTSATCSLACASRRRCTYRFARRSPGWRRRRRRSRSCSRPTSCDAGWSRCRSTTRGFAPTRTTYFNSRLTQAPRDSNHGLEIVTTYCTTVETQQRAFEALAFKIEMLWVMIDTIYNAYREE